MAIRQSSNEGRTAVVARAANPAPAPMSSSQTENLSDMVVRNPAPDGSPSREPNGMYRIIPATRG
jgi:hypothetical protein